MLSLDCILLLLSFMAAFCVILYIVKNMSFGEDAYSDNDDSIRSIIKSDDRQIKKIIAEAAFY